MRKAQLEIIGLLTIIVLLIFLGLIYIMFAGKEEQGSLTMDVVQYEKVQSLLDAFIQLTPCYIKTPYDQMETIIKDCYTSGSSATTCGKPCEELITEEIGLVMDSYNPKQDYEFKILKGKEEFISQGTCPANVETRAGSITLTAGKDTLTIKLTYCIK